MIGGAFGLRQNSTQLGQCPHRSKKDCHAVATPKLRSATLGIGNLANRSPYLEPVFC